MTPTTREGTFLALIAQGLTDREIAVQLSFSVCTARKHREILLEKFRVKRSAQLVTQYFISHPDTIKKRQLNRPFHRASIKSCGSSATG
jgi:DNA-binding CsgD family transcriptional regulator